jgi:hypothetical protein
MGAKAQGPFNSSERTQEKGPICLGIQGVRAARAANRLKNYFFFLCRFLRRRFLRLCVAILWRFLFFPQGMASSWVYWVLLSLVFCKERRIYEGFCDKTATVGDKSPPGASEEQ